MTLCLSGVGLTHTKGAEALQDINLTIAAGERVAIIGPSGAGKTTLLRLLATHLQPTVGSVEVLDSQPWNLSARARKKLRSRIGLIHQAPPLPPRQRVVIAVTAGRLGQWSLARALVNLVHPLDSAGACAELARLDLAEKLFKRCDQLSGGELQRVGVARVLYQAPQLMLADEPVSAMDPVLASHTLAVLIQQAATRGVTLVASLHAVELALKHFPRIIGLRDGRILFDRPAAEVTRAELDQLYANEQLQTPPLSAAEPAPLRIPLC
jgi:phosphonate transport system ATP-binding protein